MKSLPKPQSRAFTIGKSKSLRKLNTILSVMVLCVLGLFLAQPGLVYAKSSDITSIWNKMKPAAGNSSGPATTPVTAPATTNDSAGKAAPKINIDYTEPQAKAAERLAKALTSAKTADEIRPAAYEALARSGMTIMSPAGVICQTGPRKIKRWLLPSQADNLALDFLEHQGWTLATLTQAVAEFPDGPGPALLKRPETLGLVLKEWANIAQQSPDHPEAFAPLLLARIAQIRGGGSDFTQEKFVPEQVELTYLELMVFTAGAFKSIPQNQGFIQSPDAKSVLAGLVSRGASLIAQPAYAGNFCSWFKDNIGDTAQDFAESGIGFLMDQAMEKVGGWLEKVGDGALAKGLSHAGGALKITNFLTSMISMYGGLSLKMTWDPAKPHYLGNEHGDTAMWITAHVSTRPLADDATLACLKYIGIEQPSSDSAKDTVVEWVALYGTPKHAQPKFPPSSRQNVGEDGTAVLELTMSQEALGDEVKKHGKIKKDMVAMQANLIVYNSNPGKIAAAGLFGGVAGANIEILKQWFANWFPKRAVARVPVEWHQLSRWRCVVDAPGGTGLRIVYTSGLGTRSIWTWTFEGDPRWSGSGQFDLQNGSREFVMTPVLKQEEVTVNATYPATARIGGTDDEPTLILGMKGNANITAKSGDGGGSVSKNVTGEKEFKLEEIE